MSVQNVLRPDHDFRGFSGKVSSGKLNVGETILLGKQLKRLKLNQ